MTYKRILNASCTQIYKLTLIKTGVRSSSDVIAKMIAAVRGVEAFILIFRVFPKKLQKLSLSLMSYAIGGNRVAFISFSDCSTN